MPHNPLIHQSLYFHSPGRLKLQPGFCDAAASRPLRDLLPVGVSLLPLQIGRD
jgi:hypothetical protein